MPNTVINKKINLHATDRKKSLTPRFTLTTDYVDDTIVVVNKPPSVLSVPNLRNMPNVLDEVERQYGKAHVVHRLDCETSGTMVFARNKEAVRDLHKQFRERKVKKVYEALGYGHCSPLCGIIQLPLIVDWPNRPKQKLDFLIGRDAITYWKKLEALTEHTRFQLQPITGRTHQLRLHLQLIGHPILGDKLYSNPIRPVMDVLYPNMCLHATELTIQHPTTGKTMVFRSKVPF